MAYTLLNTRPKHQAEGLNALLADAGIEALSCPLIEIDWLMPKESFHNESSALQNDYDRAVFTSANAVTGWLCWQQSSPANRISFKQGIAIGQATQNKARQNHIDLTCLSEQKFDSEHLLQHPSMQDLKGQRILLVTGENGRQKLPQTLKQRGAQLDEFFVYRRQPAPFCAVQWQQFLASKQPVLLISSLQAWQQLKSQLVTHYQLKDLFSEQGETQIWQAIDAVLVYSERIANQLVEDGYNGHIQILSTQSDQGVLQAINALTGKSNQ